MANILLIYPPVIDYGTDLCQPNGLLAIGSNAKRAGHDVRILLPSADIKEKISENLEWADLVGFSVMSCQVGAAYMLSKWIKSVDKDKIIVWGGVHCTLYPEQTIKSEYIDYLFTGEADDTFTEWLTKHNNDIPGLWTKDFGNPAPKPTNDLPVIDYSLIDMDSYFKSTGKRTLEYFTSRSCPYLCKFCLNRRPEFIGLRKIPLKRVLQELRENIHKYAITHVQFRDDYFVGNQIDAIKILDYVQSVGCTWLICARASDFQEPSKLSEFIRGMTYNCVAIGFESGSDRTLKYLNKGVTVEQNIKAFEMLKELGVGITGTFMYCIPGERREDVLATARLVHEFSKYSRSDCSPSVFRPYPGNEVYQDCVKHGFKEPQSLEEWAKGDFLSRITIHIPWLKDPWYVEFINWFQGLTYLARKKFPLAKWYLELSIKQQMELRWSDMWLIYQVKRLAYQYRAKHALSLDN